MIRRLMILVLGLGFDLGSGLAPAQERAAQRGDQPRPLPAAAARTGRPRERRGRWPRAAATPSRRGWKS